MWLEPFSLRLDSPLETARGPISERRGLLVGIEREPGDDGDAGHSGLGEATPLPGWTESYADCEATLSALADCEEGDAGGDEATDGAADAGDMGDDEASDADDGLLTAVDDAESAATVLDATGIDPDSTPAAAHAVELAALDAAGRRTDTSLATLLRRAAFGDRDDAVETIPKAVSVNATIGDGDVESTVSAAEAAIEAGFDCLKCKVGNRGVDDDIERIRAVRSAVGEGVELRVDANGAWGRASAIRAVHALAALDVALVEQPLPAEDLVGHRELRRRGVDIAVDESLAAYDLTEVLAAEAADVVVCKPMALGGPLRAATAAATARAAGVEPVVTTTIDAVVARTAAVHVARAIPDVSACGLATASLLAADLASDPVTIAEGTASVPTGGGLCGDGFASLAKR